MKLVFDIDTHTNEIKIEYNFDPEKKETLKQVAIALYHFNPPTSGFFEQIFQWLGKHEPTLQDEFRELLHHEEPVVPPENVE